MLWPARTAEPRAIRYPTRYATLLPRARRAAEDLRESARPRSSRFSSRSSSSCCWGSIYGDRDTIGGVNAGTYLLAGLLGYGIVSTAFAGLAIQLVVRRESGVLKRVRGTPLPPRIYMGAVIGSTLLVIGLEAVIQLLIGRFLIDADLPQSPGTFVFTISSARWRSPRSASP